MTEGLRGVVDAQFYIRLGLQEPEMPGFRPSQGVLASPVQVAIDALLRRPVASEAVPADAPAAQWHRPASAACARSAGIRLGQRARRDAASTDSASDVQGGGATGAAGAECCGSSSGSMLDAADVDEIPQTPDSVADEYALVPFEDYGASRHSSHRRHEAVSHVRRKLVVLELDEKHCILAR